MALRSRVGWRCVPPPTTQSLEHGDLILNDRRVRNRNRRVGGNESLFARQEIEIAHRPRGELAMRQVEGAARLFLKGNQRRMVVEFGHIGG